MTEALLGALKEVDLQMHAQASGINCYIHQVFGRNQGSFFEEIR